jgi:predicted DNA-binding transcriptional regulator AlpA
MAKRAKRLISRKEVCERVGLSYTEIWDRMVHFKFPKGVKLGDKQTSKVMWIEEEIEKWIDNLPRQKLKRYRPKLKPKGGSSA